MAHRAAHDPPQDIAPALVARQHAVGDQEARRAKMIGDHAVARLALALGFGPGQLGRGRDQRPERVRIVIVVDALQHRRDPLQPHAGVDRRVGQLGDLDVVFLQELHEDEVPDLGEPVAILIGASGRPAGDMVAMIVKDFRAGPARAVGAHRPEIVLGRNADDALVRKARDLLPQIPGLVVGMIDGGGQPAGVEAPFPGQQIPGEQDRPFLEIIAEREIAEHFEEGVVARGIADIVEVVMLAAGADAFLRRGGGDIGPRLEAGEHVLERHHAGVDEHQGRIVLRHERRRAHDLMPRAPEIIEEGAADVVGRCHGRDLGDMLRCGKRRFLRGGGTSRPIPPLNFRING